MFLLIGKNGILPNKINTFTNTAKLLEYNCIVLGVLVDKEPKKVDCMRLVRECHVNRKHISEGEYSAIAIKFNVGVKA